MGSGYYPLGQTYDKTTGFDRLVKAQELIRAVLDEFPYDDSQTDNAATDGAYRERLYVALEMIEYAKGA